MQRLDRIRARHGSLSDTVLETIASFSPAAAKCLNDLPYFIRVWDAAHALDDALAKGRLAYQAQARLHSLLQEVPQ